MPATITTTLSRDEWDAVLKRRTENAIADVANVTDSDLDMQHAELLDNEDALMLFQGMLFAARTLLVEAMRVEQDCPEARELRHVIEVEIARQTGDIDHNDSASLESYQAAFAYLLHGIEP